MCSQPTLFSKFKMKSYEIIMTKYVNMAAADNNTFITVYIYIL